MLVKEVMSRNLFYCVPSDTAQLAAKTMRTEGVGSLPVVSGPTYRKLEGIVTDRDLCCSVVADSKLAETTRIANIMTREPVTCTPENTLDACEKLMQQHQIRRLPVVDKQGNCVGMIAQADIALHASAAKIAKTLKGISRPVRPQRETRAAHA
jgi:CBS domain-containing protein